jgi:phospholipid/cholesterol/gamma-HCH transport system ATP-binding protein
MQAEAPAAPAISVRGLGVAYGDHEILRDCSFDIMEGEIVTVLGRSGCGKTTLFKAVVGLIAPTSGEVVMHGRVVTPLSEGEALFDIGVLFQSGALFSDLTIAENTAFPLRYFTNLPDALIRRIVAAKLAMVGLSGYETYLPSELSGGMQKRAGLARAVALEPKILFFDEPSAGLDPLTAAELDQTILQINNELKTTIVVITHELASIFTIAHRCIMLDPDEKTVIAVGSPEELRQSSDRRVRSFFNRSLSEK